jgi:hypothetical protein
MQYHSPPPLAIELELALPAMDMTFPLMTLLIMLKLWTIAASGS